MSPRRPPPPLDLGAPNEPPPTADHLSSGRRLCAIRVHRTTSACCISSLRLRRPPLFAHIGPAGCLSRKSHFVPQSPPRGHCTGLGCAGDEEIFFFLRRGTKRFHVCVVGHGPKRTGPFTWLDQPTMASAVLVIPATFSHPSTQTRLR